jgi:hypothetical protein
VPSPARHEWAKRISEFVLDYGLKPTTKFQQLLPPLKKKIQSGIWVWIEDPFSCVRMAQNAFGTIVVIGIRIIVIESFITEHYVRMGVQSYICKATLCR